jgi:hypothetical protein
MKTQWPKLSRWWQSVIWKNVNSFFTSLPFNKISSNIKNLGVSFGKSNTHMMHSIVSIKNIEIDRLSVATKTPSSDLNKQHFSHPFNTEEVEDDIGLDAKLRVCLVGIWLWKKL